MPGFQTHITVSTAVGIGYAVWGGTQYDLPFSTCALAGGLLAVAGCSDVFHVAADYRLWVRDPAAMYATNVDATVDLIIGDGFKGLARPADADAALAELTAPRPAPTPVKKEC